jgi:hypothetical protein
MKNVQITKSIKDPESEGVFYRLLCLTGENKGTSYYLKGDRLILGREKEADIPVLDIQCSKHHAELKKIGQNYIITDLGSKNGLFINEERIIQKSLLNDDRLIVGRTVFKYNIISVTPKITKLKLIPQEPSEEEIQPATAPKKRMNKMLLLIIGALAIFFLLPGQPKKGVAVKKEEKEIKGDTLEQEFKSFTAPATSESEKEIKEKIAGSIQRGLRELRENNYFRAIQDFNMALIMQPNHPMASFYLSKTKQALNEEIALNFLRGKREEEALKYDAAIVTNCAIVSLLQGYETDERYLEAKANIVRYEEQLGLEKGETKCTEK